MHAPTPLERSRSNNGDLKKSSNIRPPIPGRLNHPRENVIVMEGNGKSEPGELQKLRTT